MSATSCIRRCTKPFCPDRRIGVSIGFCLPKKWREDENFPSNMLIFHLLFLLLQIIYKAQ